MSEFATCPHCGATNPADAEWCGQCYQRIAVAPAAVAPDVADQPQPAASDPAAGAATRSGWECRACGATNEVEASVCGTCGTSIYDSYGGHDSEEARDPDLALRRAIIFPGLGYGSLNRGAIGFVVGFLAVASLVVGVMLIIAGELSGVALVVLFIAIWVLSVVDVVRLSQGASEPLLRARTLSIIGGIVVALLFISILVAFQETQS